MLRQKVQARHFLPAIIVALLPAVGCALHKRIEARNMPPEKIAQLSDEQVCKYLDSFGRSTTPLPAKWVRAAQQRDLKMCWEQGRSAIQGDVEFD